MLAPRPKCFERWLEFLRPAELPPKTSLYVLDNSGGILSAPLNEAIGSLRSRGIRRVDMAECAVSITTAMWSLRGAGRDHLQNLANQN